MTNPQDAQSLLMGGGGRSWSWAVKQPDGSFVDKPAGTSVTGTVNASGISEQQQTDIRSGALQTWPDGKPKMQIVIPLQTQFKDDTDDDGQRSLWVKQSSNLQAAIRDAVRAAGVKSLADGGTLTVTFTGTRAASQPGMNPIKLFTASYTPPTQQGALMDGQAQTNTASMGSLEGFTPSTPAPSLAPSQFAPTAPPSVPEDVKAAVKGLLGLGRSVEEVSAVTGLTVEQINQLPPF